MVENSISIDGILENYINWIKENNHFKMNTNHVIELATPFIDNFGDNINLILKQEGNKVKISDDAYFIWNLEAHGLNVTKNNSKRLNILKSIIEFSNISFDEKTCELYKIVNPKNVGQGIHEMTEALNRISDLMFLNQTSVKSIFTEDVFSYLKENKEIYDYFPDVQIVGQSKLSFNFDALFNTRNRNKKLVRIYNSFSKNNVENALLSWLDTIPYRKKHYGDQVSMAIVVNDEDGKPLSSEYLDALSEYEIGVIPFSDKELFKTELSLVG